MNEFSPMVMSHDGQILEKLLDELGVKKSVLAEKIEKNPNTITRMLQRSSIKNEYLIEIGKALRFDLTHKFPRLKKIPEASKLNYFNEDPDQLLSKVTEMEGKYEVNAKKTADQELEIKFLKEQIESLKTVIDAKNQIIEMQSDTIKQLKGQ